MFVEGDTLLKGNYSKESENPAQVCPEIPAHPVAWSTCRHRRIQTGGYNEQAFSKILQSALAESIMRNAMSGMPGGMPGGTGLGEAVPLEEQLSYDPESSWTYELGGRYEMFERRLSLTYALFYTRVNNIQIIKLEDQGTSGRTVRNAGKSRSRGFELSMRYTPATNFSIYGDYGFADARFTDYEASEEVDYSATISPSHHDIR